MINEKRKLFDMWCDHYNHVTWFDVIMVAKEQSVHTVSELKWRLNRIESRREKIKTGLRRTTG